MANDPAFRGDFPHAVPHQVPLFLSCRHKDQPCGPGPALIAGMQKALAMAGLSDAFEVSGTACTAGCDRPCTVAWQASVKATWSFGDIDPDQDIDDLVAFAKPYQRLEDGLCRAADRPGKLARTTLACIRAASVMTGSRGAPQ